MFQQRNNFFLQQSQTPNKQTAKSFYDENLTQQHSFNQNFSTKANSTFEKSWINIQTNDKRKLKKRLNSTNSHITKENQKSQKKENEFQGELSYDYKGEYYPPPQHLHHRLADKIKQILHRDKHEDYKSILKIIEDKKAERISLSPSPTKKSKQSTKKQLEQQKIKQKQISSDIYSHAYEKVDDDEIFVDPTQYNLFKNKRFSKIKELYIREYQDYMDKDKAEKGYQDHPEMVDNLLYNQLSASAVATHKWNSYRAQMNILKLKPQSKNICSYPLSPRVVKEIDQIQQKRDFRRNMILKVKGADLQHEKVKDNLVFDLNSSQINYMNNLEKIHQDKEVVYGDTWDEYIQILDYKQTLDDKNDNHELVQAYNDFQFIKRKKGEFQKAKVEKENIEYQKKIEEQERIEYLNDFYGNCQKNQFVPLPRQRVFEREQRSLSMSLKKNPAHQVSQEQKSFSQKEDDQLDTIKSGYQDEVYLVKPKTHLKSKIKTKFYLKE
ncbi:hypothetical protein ABPG74_002035 [Tetrahymena malaccensis]